MNKYPKITIMIATYNQAHLISTAIESALAQDYPNLEVIVADDCSPDNTREIVEKYLRDGRLKYFRNDKNLGCGASYRKTLYERATGDWVVNLDGDDYYTDSGFLSAAMDNAKGNPDIVLIGAGAEKVYGNGYKVMHKVSDTNRVIDGFQLFMNWPKVNIWHLSAIYKRALALELWFYRFANHASDWDSLLRLALHGKVMLLNRVVGACRKGGGNLTCDVDFERWMEKAQWIESPYRHALELGFEGKLLRKWKKKMIRYHFLSYMNTNIDLSRQNLIELKSARANIWSLARYTAQHEKFLLHDPLFLFTMLLALALKPQAYEKAKIRAKDLLGFS